MDKQIEIHEFSTGIVVEIKPDGSWFSRGFTGRYMNQTIDPIPNPIQEAISNRLFAIAEGASSETSSLIGREVGSNDEIWSVVTVVNKARDESRSFSAYRYFCIEGKGNINKILHFLNKNPLKFNPLDVKTIDNPHLLTDNPETKVPLDNFQDLFTDSLPVIVPSDRTSSPIIINRIAEEIAGDGLIAWAYNVQAVETLRSFYVIKCSDDKAEEIIRKNLSNQITLNHPIFEEQKIKIAITALCKRNKIKLEYIKTIEEALINPNINDKFWHSIFDGQGLKQAKIQGIYNDEMTRLFTLQALILPDTLPEFLTWVKNIKKEEFLVTSNNFQWEILKVFTTEFKSESFVNKIETAVESIILKLLDDNTLVNEVIWLLKSDKSLWGYFYINRISKYIDHDLQLMKSYVKQKEIKHNFQLVEEESWLKVADELTIAWRYGRFKPINKYQVLVTLFDGLNEAKFALLFAHFAYDKVPKSIFSKVKSISFGTNFYHQIYDVKVYREVGGFEQFLLNSIKFVNREIDMKLWTVIILIIISGLTGFTARVFLFQSKLEKTANKFIEKQTASITDKKELKVEKTKLRDNIEKAFSEDKNNLISQVLECYPSVEKCEVKNKSSEQIKTALSKFEATRGSILTIQNITKKDDNNMQEKLRKILKEDTLNYTETIKNKNEKDQEKWVKAIYKYQFDNGLSQDGIISEKGQTIKKIQEEIE
ncbi:hypothetical protein GM3708_1732 [Geminocystis sp. NIES-3708]|uniref:hypothetical protein n=1 Tax=Geminocystis sp. NIES-3708 TaxID=1615909 RepID=UPI0005FC89F7|nr:hypothetical protein [Geminocystis sp. NIES-3708]BAQ61326.1 hypothetical protein GM3708_1732 [Geminocystis sp. NIES-3708]